MSNQADKSTTDQILDLLLDALVERQKARRAEGPPSPTDRGPVPSTPKERGVVPPSWPDPPSTEQHLTSREAPAKAVPPPSSREPQPGDKDWQPSTSAPRERPVVPPPRPEPSSAEQQRITRPASVMSAPPPSSREPHLGDKDWEPPPRLPSIQMGKMIGRLAILVVILLILVNIPVNRYGVSLARILPETSSLIIRDGLVLKGSGPEIYILEDDKLRWISSMDAFEHLGLTWEGVHVVEDGFLDKFDKGRPIHVLLKCQASPHIYRLENNQKRWIKDIDTFLAEGHAWEDVRFVSCQYLRDIPNGPPIPEDAGPAPEP